MLALQSNPIGTPANHEFWDSFTYALVLICIVLSLTDWLLGSQRRGRLRSRVEDWWVYVEDSTIGTATRRSAANIAAALRKLYGMNKSWLTQIGIQVVLLGPGFFGLGIVMAWFMWLGKYPKLQPHQIGFDIDFIYFPAAFCIAIGILTSRLSARSFELIAKSESVVLYTLSLIAGTLLLAFLIFTMIAMVIFANIVEYQLRPIMYREDILRVPEFEHTYQLSFCGLEKSIKTEWHVTWATVAMAAPPILLPTIVFVFSVLGFILAKTFRHVLKPVVSTILARFAESQHGVLTTLSIAGGVLAKLIEESVKLLSN